MTFYQNLTCIGKDDWFYKAGNCHLSENGFFIIDDLGGPEALAKLNDFVPRNDDIYVVSFPKTGTTWMQEVAFLVGTNVDFETANKLNVMVRCPYLEWKTRPTTEINVTKPRFLKLHLPFSMIPKAILDANCKIIYTMRNPKDTLVSFYHFCKSVEFMNFNGNFNEFFEAFLKGKVPYGPYWKHCQEFLEQKHRDNIFITTYEDMKTDLPSVIRKVATFLDKSLTNDQVCAIQKHCGFDAMKNNQSTNPNMDPRIGSMLAGNKSSFLRKGEVGDWKNYFTEEMNKKMDEHIAQHFQGIDFRYE